MAADVEMISERREYAFVDAFPEIADEDHFWYRWRLKALMRQIDDLGISRDDRLEALEVGAGTGVLREQIERETKWNIDISDIDYRSLSEAHPGRGRTFYYDILERSPELAEAYDAIFLFDVLEHIENTRPFIEALEHHLRPGGMLFVNVPALNMLFSRFDTVQGHFRRYDKRTLETEFSGSGFNVLDTRYWGLANVPLLLARRFSLAVFSRGLSDEEIYRRGFGLPGRAVNGSLTATMQIETAVTSRPPLGSSVLLAAKKK